MIVLTKIQKTSLIALSLALLCACGTTTSIETVKDSQYKKEIKKIVALTPMPSSTTDGNSSAFIDYFQQKLRRCDIEVLLGTPMSPFMSKSQTVELANKSDHPDAVLLVVPESIEAVTINNGAANPRSAKIIFTLVNPSNEKNIWKAAMDAKFIYTNSKEAGATMANDILKKMTADGILPTCAAALQ